MPKHSPYRESLLRQGFIKTHDTNGFEMWEKITIPGNLSTCIHLRAGFEPPVEVKAMNIGKVTVDLKLSSYFPFPPSARGFMATWSRERLVETCGKKNVEVPENATKDDLLALLVGPLPSPAPVIAPAKAPPEPTKGLVEEKGPLSPPKPPASQNASGESAPKTNADRKKEKLERQAREREAAKHKK